MNSRGWKSFSILSTTMISSRFTNLLNSVRRLFDIFFIFSKSCFIFWLSCFISRSSSSISCLDDMRFFPISRTRSLISLFLSSRSRSLVLNSVIRNCVLSWNESAILFYGGEV